MTWTELAGQLRAAFEVVGDGESLNIVARTRDGRIGQIVQLQHKPAIGRERVVILAAVSPVPSGDAVAMLAAAYEIVFGSMVSVANIMVLRHVLSMDTLAYVDVDEIIRYLARCAAAMRTRVGGTWDPSSIVYEPFMD